MNPFALNITSSLDHQHQRNVACISNLPPLPLTGVTMVKYVESEGEWAELMEQSKGKLLVVDFTASW